MTTGIIVFVLMLEILLGRGYECLPVVSLQSQFATSGFAAYRSRLILQQRLLVSICQKLGF